MNAEKITALYAASIAAIDAAEHAQRKYLVALRREGVDVGLPNGLAWEIKDARKRLDALLQIRGREGSRPRA